VKKKKVLAK